MQLIVFLLSQNQDLLAKAQFVILHGHRLAANHHYALDLICQRCNELRYLSDILVNEIKAKRIQLSRTFKMHKLLQQVVSWENGALLKKKIKILLGSFSDVIGSGSGIALELKL